MHINFSYVLWWKKLHRWWLDVIIDYNITLDTLTKIN